MKNISFKILSILFVLILTMPAVNSQVPEGFSYQAIARNSSGTPIDEAPLNVRIAILSSISPQVVLWEEEHAVTTNTFGLFSIIVGSSDVKTAGSLSSFSDIDWSSGDFYLRPSIKESGGAWQILDPAMIQSVPFSIATRSHSGGKLEVVSLDDASVEALFEVRRKDGQPVFSVFPDRVEMHVDDVGKKGAKGGFSVAGFDRSKGSQDYLLVSPDSVRVYIPKTDVTSKAAGSRGGFAVGGFDPANKSPEDMFLNVSGANVSGEAGEKSFSFGSLSTAPGNHSISLGTGANASGNTSISFGYYSSATNTNAVAMGNHATATGLNSTALGYYPQANGEKSIAIGSHYNYSFSLLPYFNYSGGKGSGSEDDGSKGDFIIWNPIITPLFRTISFNRANIANGKYSISFGNGNLSNNGGMALGSNNDALQFGAVALGVSNKSLNTNSFAAGYNSTADGYYSTAIGNNAHAKAYGSFAIGQYNVVSGDSTEWRNTDPLFIVGNGLNNDNRNNALTIYKDGRTIFKGADANITLNDRRKFYRLPPLSPVLNVYGIRSYINRSDADIDNYYTGYFFDIGSEGTYQGFYADQRSGGAIDVAEYIYDSNDNTEAADVVVADIHNTESVILSNEPYQTSVVGIISTEPHLTMGMELVIDEATGSPLPGVKATRLALTGRVPCKVTDENGTIKPGDLLTSSSTAGHAMKWTLLDVNEANSFEELKSMIAENERRRNAIIGKALEEHSGGIGKIVVLVSLQ